MPHRSNRDPSSRACPAGRLPVRSALARAAFVAALLTCCEVVRPFAAAQQTSAAAPRDPAFAIAYIDPTGHVAVVDPRAADPAGTTASYGSGRQV